MRALVVVLLLCLATPCLADEADDLALLAADTEVARRVCLAERDFLHAQLSRELATARSIEAERRRWRAAVVVAVVGGVLLGAGLTVGAGWALGQAQ